MKKVDLLSKTKTKYKYLISSFSIFGLALAVTLAAPWGLRSLAELRSFDKNRDAELKAILLKPNHSSLIRTAKLKPPFEIEIHKSENTTVVPDKPFELVARISTTKVLTGLNYTWVLPPDVVAVRAEKTHGQIASLSPKGEATISIDVVQIGKGKPDFSESDNRQIHLKVSVQSDGAPIINTAQYNTVLEESIRKEHVELSMKNAQYIIEQQNERFKMQR